MEIINKGEPALLADVDSKKRKALGDWFAVVEGASWHSLTDVQSTFAWVKQNGDKVVFECEHFCLITLINFADRRVYLLEQNFLEANQDMNNINSEYFELVKSYPLIPIRSDDHLNEAISVMKNIAFKGAELSEGASDYLSVLGTLISQYEKNERVIHNDRTPQEVLKYLLEVNKLGQSDIVHLVGHKSNLSAFLAGKRELSKQAAAKLGDYFKVSATVFQTRETQTSDWIKSRLAPDRLGRMLNLNGEDISAKQIDDIVRCSEIAGLDLSNTDIDDSTLSKIAKMRHLKSLILSHTKITDKGLSYLKSMTNLQNLDLKYTKVTDKGLSHLAQLRSLGGVNLLGIAFDGSGFDSISNLKDTWIWLGDVKFSKNTLKALSNSKLRLIGFYFDSIDDDGVKILCKSETLFDLCIYSDVSAKIVDYVLACKSLKRLWLGCTSRITDDDIPELARLTTLNMLDLSACTAISKPAIKKLQAMLPNTSIKGFDKA